MSHTSGSFDLAQIVRETSVSHVEYHETLDSTSKLAVELLDDLLVGQPTLVLTSNQTSGRGRGSNPWWATSGALTFTLVRPVSTIPLSADRLPLISFATGLAVHRTLSRRLPAAELKVKWPNDVMVGESKICGILTEHRPCETENAVLIGVGINVNNSMMVAPAEIHQRATSLFDITGSVVQLTDVLIETLKEFDRLLLQLNNGPNEVLAELNRCSFLTGREVTLTTDVEVAGPCHGISGRGELILEVDGVLRVFSGGTVSNWG